MGWGRCLDWEGLAKLSKCKTAAPPIGNATVLLLFD